MLGVTLAPGITGASAKFVNSTGATTNASGEGTWLAATCDGLEYAYSITDSGYVTVPWSHLQTFAGATTIPVTLYATSDLVTVSGTITDGTGVPAQGWCTSV